MSDKKREPSCTNNHDVQRRMLRDAGLPERPCPNCGWVLHPAREEPIASNVCPECFAVVNDLYEHQEWHQDMADRLEEIATSVTKLRQAVFPLA